MYEFVKNSRHPRHRTRQRSNQVVCRIQAYHDHQIRWRLTAERNPEIVVEVIPVDFRIKRNQPFAVPVFDGVRVVEDALGFEGIRLAGVERKHDPAAPAHVQGGYFRPAFRYADPRAENADRFDGIHSGIGELDFGAKE